MAATRIVPQGRAAADTQQQADARVRLKLVAMAYADARHGARDPDDGLVRTALVALHEVAILYRRSLSGRPGDQEDRRSPPASPGALLHLQVLAIAYASARHGADSCPELCRDALGVLCSGAAWYAEAVEHDDQGDPDRSDRPGRGSRGMVDDGAR
jgi:hypothetical protein